MNGKIIKLRKNTRDAGLYTEQEMARIHEYERLRTDRNGMKFSHIILEFDSKVVKRRTINTIQGKLLNQLRITDHIGWENTEQIGIILPGTDEVGAKHFIRNTKELLGDLVGVNIELAATYPLPETLLAAVSASSTNIVNNETVSEPMEIEEVTVIPFSVAK